MRKLIELPNHAGPDDIAAGECPGSGATDAHLVCLATAYAPLLKFDSGETFFPCGVDEFLPYMKLVRDFALMTND